VNTTVRKEELVERVGKPIRVVRDAIARLVIEGVPIIPDRENGGYRFSNEPILIVSEIRRLASHCRQIRRRYEGLANYLTRIGVTSDIYADGDEDAWWTDRLDVD
jgi:hypothetical protein